MERERRRARWTKARVGGTSFVREGPKSWRDRKIKPSGESLFFAGRNAPSQSGCLALIFGRSILPNSIQVDVFFAGMVSVCEVGVGGRFALRVAKRKWVVVRVEAGKNGKSKKKL
jgi:hypothetical protein